MKKIAFVIQRFGKDVLGGSESLAMQYALHLKVFYNIDVITTTCNDHMTWDNFYPEGRTREGGINIIRFPTTQKRLSSELDKISVEQINNINSNLQTEHDKAWLDAQGPYCPDLISYIETHKNHYDVFIFFTYLYYPTVYGMPTVSNKSIFVPTTHDEIWIRQTIFKMLFHIPKHFVFMTEEEKNFVHSFFLNNYIKSDVVGTGINIPEKVNPEGFKRKYDIKDDYLIYTGRINSGKGCDEMISHFIAYKKVHPSSLKLVLIGKGELDIPIRDDVIATGYVDDQTKYDGIAGASLLISPSKYESLSLSLLEGFALGVPALANGLCDVLRGHCDKSEAGFYYTNEEEFIERANQILLNSDTHNKMSKKAKKYIKDNYTWKRAVEKLCHAIDYVEKSSNDENTIVIDFRLSGFGDAHLEDIVRNSVEKANYSDKEMADIRIPKSFDVSEYIFTVNNVLNKFSQWQVAATLNPDIVIPRDKSIKSILKRKLAKMFRWYILPFADSQSRFNAETIAMIYELATHVQTQEKTISNLQEYIKKAGE